MVKEAKIKISSVIENLGGGALAMGEPERTEGEYSGYYHVVDGERFITYTESAEGAFVSSEIRYLGGQVRVIRKGAVESDMLFSDTAEHLSLYKVGPYTFDCRVKARKIRAELDGQGGRLELYYNMKIGGAEKSAIMKIWISTN